VNLRYVVGDERADVAEGIRNIRVGLVAAQGKFAQTCVAPWRIWICCHMKEALYYLSGSKMIGFRDLLRSHSPCSYYWDEASCCAYSTLKMEVKCFSKTSVDFQQTTQHYILEDSTLHNHHCANLKFYRCPIISAK
jgi:hypothetical protein